jgi:hypothetical protein
VYLYDATADDGNGKLTCASCNPTGVQVTPTDANFSYRAGVSGAATTAYLNRAVSDNGRFVFFSTGEELVPADVNGSVYDVYQYDSFTGETNLLSTGRSTRSSFFLDASTDGGDVFFTTRERLVGWDRDNQTDVYTARIDGGLPEPSSPSPSCKGDGCRGATSGAPVPRAPGSTVFNASGGRRASVGTLHIARISLAQRRRFAKTGRLVLQVRVPRAGKVVVRSNRGRTLAVRTGGPTSKHLSLRLSRDARERLSRTGRLRVRIVVRFGTSKRTATFVLRSDK